ncbi:hypothetical protein BU16DRAFT_549904 [Lophium mytilinum]|uniref:Lytic polysaccharide monooxygenase n=1 Tax=Lophium mytilinum TaxID=390894 RepID=A0A6A6QZ66_9PEZI|nr:hypothetical protein BU16DRAFT_549904 [Lophium mytilinum]
MTGVSGHMFMKTPVPFSGQDNSPLVESGANFPCKNIPYEVATMNNMKVGENLTLSFTGTATHGGGSCQLSVTMDKKPTKDSKFKVIYSIEGGCPGNGPGNNGPSTFPFSIPKEVPNGESTFIWSWQNKVGNREFYTSCAPITVSGGASDHSAFDQLPDMAVANIDSQNKCKTTAGSDYKYENPGEHVTVIGNGPFLGLCGGPAPPGGGQGTQPATMPNTVAPSAPSMSGPPTGLMASTPSTLVTVTGSPPDSAAPSAPAASSVPAVPSVPAAPSIPVAPSGSPSTGGGGGTCSKNGDIVCKGEDQYGICNFGNVIWQPVAAGTKCQNGKIAKRFRASIR